jgi:hypothetical protein
MDLAKIIGDLKLELKCLDVAIASMEELARIQNISVPSPVQTTPSTPLPAMQEPPPLKRGRGRPRKYAAPFAAVEPQTVAPESEPGVELRSSENG